MRSSLALRQAHQHPLFQLVLCGGRFVGKEEAALQAFDRLLAAAR
ncbi:MAG: hypothetical protein ABSD11_19215 [Methylocella sp.]